MGTIQDELYTVLATEIRAGTYAPGERLSVDEIAKTRGISAMPVRDALRRLAEIGVVVMRPKSAVRLAVIDRLAFDELASMRVALETVAVRQAAQRNPEASPALFRLAELAEAALDRNDARTYARANAEFHFALYSEGAGPTLLKAISDLWLRLGPYIRYWGIEGSRIGRDRHAHAALAIGRGDADVAASLIAADIQSGIDIIRSAAFPEPLPRRKRRIKPPDD